MSPRGGQKGGKVELTHLIDIGSWQSMLDSLSAELHTGISIFNERREIILQSGVAELCREAMRRKGIHPACLRCCDVKDFPNYDHGGFALCPYCDRLINFVFNFRVAGMRGHVIVGPVWIAEKGTRATLARLARKFGMGQAKFAQLTAKISYYPIDEFRKVGEMVFSTMRVIAHTLGVNVDLVTEVNELKGLLATERKRTWEQMARDRLTGVYRYDYGLARLKEEIARAERYNQSLSVIVVGIEQFRSYADRFGAEAVNGLLKNIGTVLQTKSRRTDLSVRLREEEFLLILPFTAEKAARTVVERLRQEVAALSFFDERGAEIEPPPLAEGLATYPADGATERDLLRKALEKVRQ